MWRGLETFLFVRNWEVVAIGIWCGGASDTSKPPAGHSSTGGLAQNAMGLALLSVMTSWASSFLPMYLFPKFSETTLE